MKAASRGSKTIRADVQYAGPDAGLPKAKEFLRWARAAVLRSDWAECVIRIVGKAESAELNRRYRSKSGATNVLSFVHEAPAGVPNDFLGDLVICAPVVREEAKAQGKEPDAHFAHMTVHGLLHLQGYDHDTESQAVRMEAIESGILCSLGYPDPYR